jgi:hypothetical protein
VGYQGGPVISNVKLVGVLWGSKVDTSVTQNVPAFFQTLVNSAYLDSLSQYSTNLPANDGPHAGSPGTDQLIGRGVYLGLFTITPHNNGTVLGDPDVQAELVAQVAQGSLPTADGNTLYVVYFPASVNVQGQCSSFCAYHNSVVALTGSIYYAVVPDYSTGPCGGQGCGLNPTFFDNQCAAVSHEIAEAITDANAGAGIEDLAWEGNLSAAANGGGEIGDICAYQDSTLTGTTGTFYVQQMWSNADQLCATTRTNPQDFSLAFPVNTVTLTEGSSTPVPVSITTATTAGAPQPLALSITGLPADVTGSLSSGPTSGGSATLTLSAQGASKGEQALAVLEADGVGIDGGVLSHTAALWVTVTAPPNDFALTGPSSMLLAPSYTSSANVFTAASGASAPTVTFAVSGLPSGVTGSFSPPSVTAGGVTELLLQTSSSATPSSGTFTVSATAGSNLKTLQVPFSFEPSTWTPVASAVNILAPLPGTSVAFGATELVVAATVDPANSIRSLVVSEGATPVLTCQVSPCTGAWTASTPGAHTLTAALTDGTGQTVTSSVTVNVANLASVTFQSPASGAKVGGPVTVTASAVAGGSAQVAQVAFYDGEFGVGSCSASPCTVTWNTSGLSAGLHTLRAQATDSQGRVSTATDTVRLLAPPAVSILTPGPNATLSGKVQVSMAAGVDPDTTLASITLLDGATTLSTCPSLPCAFSWDTGRGKNGTHTLTATVKDAVGQSASVSMDVWVSNSGCSAGGGLGPWSLAGVLLWAAGWRRRPVRCSGSPLKARRRWGRSTT